jgi:hypothetical protein
MLEFFKEIAVVAQAKLGDAGEAFREPEQKGFLDDLFGSSLILGFFLDCKKLLEPSHDSSNLEFLSANHESPKVLT